MSVVKGWDALRQGNLDLAQQHFSAGNSAESRRGLAKVFVARQEHDMAFAVMQTNMAAPTALDYGLFADIQRRRGNSDMSMTILSIAMERFSDPYLDAVLGGLHVRSGAWNLGLECFTKALRADSEGEATAHILSVLSDLSNAVANGRVPSKRALDLVETLNEVADGWARQQIDAAMSAISLGEPWRANSTNPSERKPPTGSDRAPVIPRRTTHRSGLVPSLLDMMRRDRMLTDKLQDGAIGPGLPEWPSSKQALDPHPPMAPEKLNYNREVMAKPLALLTEGAIDLEIAVERASESLRAIGSLHARDVLDYNAFGVARLEFMLWDGIADELESIPEIYKPESMVNIDARVLSLGGFLGTVAVRSFGGHWSFDNDLRHSVVRVGDVELLPFHFAQRWLSKQTAFDLLTFVDMASAAMKSSVFELEADPTRGLVGTTLNLRLAEQWLDYFARPLVDVIDASDSIEVLERFPTVTLFSIDQRFLPTTLQSAGASRIGYSHVSQTFFYLSVPAHVARVLNEAVPRFDAEKLELVEQIFRASQAPESSFQAMQVDESSDSEVLLSVEGTRGNSAVYWELKYREEAASPWNVTRVD